MAPTFNVRTLHEDMQWDAGLGLRVWAKGLIGRVDVAYSDEGAGSADDDRSPVSVLMNVCGTRERMRPLLMRKRTLNNRVVMFVATETSLLQRSMRALSRYAIAELRRVLSKCTARRRQMTRTIVLDRDSLIHSVPRASGLIQSRRDRHRQATRMQHIWQAVITCAIPQATGGRRSRSQVSPPSLRPKPLRTCFSPASQRSDLLRTWTNARDATCPLVNNPRLESRCLGVEIRTWPAPEIQNVSESLR